MVWDKWIPEKFLVRQEVCAVEACLTDEDSIFYYMLLKKKNRQLVLGDLGSAKSINTLPSVVKKNKIPLLLIINGHGVITRRINIADSSVPTEELIKQNLPSINIEDFYIQVFIQEDQSGYISLCRKNLINALLAEAMNNEFEIAAIHIGPCTITGMRPLWNSLSAVKSSLQAIELRNNNIESISSLPKGDEIKNIGLDGFSFPSSHTLGFSAGLAYLMHTEIGESASPELATYFEAHVEKNKFRFQLICAVAFAFLLAFGNVIFYSINFEKNNKLESELDVYQGKYDKISQLLEKYQKNKYLIEQAGILSRNRLSEYADRIALTLPDEVTLSDLYFNPKIEEEESNDSLVKFESRRMVIKGNCPKSLIVNEWINVLKMQRFVKDIQLQKFVYNNDGLLPNFEIKLVTE
jgi:hypothetical protein